MAKIGNMQQAVEAIKTRQYGEAAEVLEGVVSKQPGDFKARWLLVRSLEQTGDFDGARRQLGEFLKYGYRDLAKINRVAEFVRQRGYPIDDVLEAYRRFLERNPGSANAVYNYAYYLGKYGQTQAALDNFQRALDLNIKAPEEVHLNVAILYMDYVQDIEKAREHLEKALSLNPSYVQAHFNLGNLAERVGDREKATRCFEKCLELDPDNDFALARLADAHQFDEADDPLLARLADKAPESKNADLQYAHGRAQDQVGDFDGAWDSFTRANELDRSVRPEYRQSRSEALIRRIIARFDSEMLSRFGGESHQAVFVCGLFRSGSTLLEQILGAHPAFTAGGESEFFPRLVAKNFRNYPDDIDRLTMDSIEKWKAEHAGLCEERTGGSSKLIDKRPDNFLHIGLIKTILPNARFVVTERDWRDSAISIFSTRLGPGQGYATRVEDARHYLALHRELIDHWATLLGDDLIRVSYEDLVNSPRETVGDLLERLGEPWDDACLEFDKQQATVGTASVWQVRQPLNPKSIGRWRNYRQQLIEVFGDDLGD